MMLNAGQKLVSMEGPAPRHLWNPQVGLVLDFQAPSLSSLPPHVPKGRNSCCQVGSCSPTHLKPP